MCLAKAYTAPDASESILNDIALLTVEDGRVTITSLFGESRVVEGRVREIDFMKSRITLETASRAARSLA
jgi:predicted RNA-binding protein